MLLQYEVGIVGLQTLARAQRSIEAGFVQHQRRLNRIVGATGPARTRASSPGSAASAAKREAADVAREQQRQLAYWRNAHVQATRARMREEDKRHRAATRNAEKEARAAQVQARREIATRRRFTESAFGRIGDSVRGSLGAVGTAGSAAAGLAGGFAAVGAVQERMRATRMASMLANQAGNPALKGELLKESRGVRGFTSEQILGGVGEFVTKTGDLDTGRKLTGTVSQLSLATGADFNDLMATAGQAFNVLKDQISDPVALLDELNAVLGTLAQQGSLGAVEIRDLAKDFGKLGAATRGFEGGAPQLLRTMGAFAQIAVARGGAESSADASTAAARLVNDMTVNRKKFAGLGVDLKSKADPTKLRDPLSIMLDVLEKTGGDVMKTSGLFGAESGKIFKGLGATFSEAEKKKKGSGRAAVEAEFKRFSGADLSAKDITARAASRLADPDLQLQEAAKEFNYAVGTQLLPMLTRLIPEFSKLVPYAEQLARRFADLAEAFAKDPIGGMAKLAAAKLALDMAISGTGEAAKKLTGALTGAATKVEGATGGPGGKLGAGMLGAQLGLSVATLIVSANVVNFEKGEAEMAAGGQRLNRARELAAKSSAGQLTPADYEELRGIQREQDKATVATKAPGLWETMGTVALKGAQYAGPVGWAATALGFDAGKTAAGIFNGEKNTQVRTQESFAKEIDGAVLGAKIGKAAAEEISKATVNAQAEPNRGNSPSPVKG